MQFLSEPEGLTMEIKPVPGANQYRQLKSQVENTYHFWKSLKGRLS